MRTLGLIKTGRLALAIIAPVLLSTCVVGAQTPLRDSTLQRFVGDLFSDVEDSTADVSVTKVEWTYQDSIPERIQTIGKTSISAHKYTVSPVTMTSLAETGHDTRSRTYDSAIVYLDDGPNPLITIMMFSRGESEGYQLLSHVLGSDGGGLIYPYLAGIPEEPPAVPFNDVIRSFASLVKGPSCIVAQYIEFCGFRHDRTPAWVIYFLPPKLGQYGPICRVVTSDGQDIASGSFVLNYQPYHAPPNDLDPRKAEN